MGIGSGLNTVRFGYQVIETVMGFASCYWEAALTAREASRRKHAGKWQDFTPVTSLTRITHTHQPPRSAYGGRCRDWRLHDALLPPPPAIADQTEDASGEEE